MPRIDDLSMDDVEALRSRGAQGALEMLLSMPNSPGNIVPAAGLFTRESANAMMRHYMKRSGVDASSLSVVHVAGTKGKGSTCAFTESILRAHGAKTGLFTSPHLIHPNERFRINGKPVSDSLFAATFWAIWDALVASESDHGGYPRIPNYFTILTLMAFRLFTLERVDVAILEVGLGGRLDATNVVDRPVVCGVTALDYDHMRILGSNLALIAREKAGIFKPGVPAFTIAQPEEATRVLVECAAAESTSLVVVPPISAQEKVTLGLNGQYQSHNAGLAMALASTWLAVKANAVVPPDHLKLTPTARIGLERTRWPGRAQKLVDPEIDRMTFHLDGAHTPLSVECCVQWFKTCVSSDRQVLIFNCHHERDIVQLFQPLLGIAFDLVIFCPTGSSRSGICKVPSAQEILEKSAINHHHPPQESKDAVDETNPLYWQHQCARVWSILNKAQGKDSTTLVVPSMDKAIQWIRKAYSTTESCVLVTGSLYTVGDALVSLDWKEE
ncbi:hypothetical protein LEN26_016049 [Aphanomyces euteiches]|nr:hypothetical protein LEN26_016049 [Aphanomyces euteiches]KAH9125010.1 hypothetical protein AeMF1_004314 [Aphanomyces euteiches]KAH9186564.1 hypothetical protein AeNC1_011459 [Aphanomyces euteiches]